VEILAIDLSEELIKLMKIHPEINWEEIAKNALVNYAKKLNLFEELLKNSEFTELDAKEFGELVKESAMKKMMSDDCSLKLVIDTNIIFSALIKDSKTREVIFSSKHQLFCLQEIFDEISKYRIEIIKRAKINEITWDKLLNEINEHLTLIPKTIVDPCKLQAAELIAHRDPKDVPFLALALCIKVDGIWSNDKDFDEQDEIKRFRTLDLLESIEED
jgi:putative PIN family toxin of toxin-antitoxin system